MDTQDRAHTSDESFDDFLADENLLAACEEEALMEIVADQTRQPGSESYARRQKDSPSES